MDLPTVRADKSRFESVELPPFRAAIAAGTSTVMTGHLAVPAYEADPDLPATLSPSLTTRLLRQELGFQGIVVTDALEMGGVTTRYAPGDVAVRSIEAGADVLLVPPVVDAALSALRDAVASGRLPISRIDDSVRRILSAKARLGLHRQRLVDVNALNSVFGRPEFAAAAQDISDRGVTLLRNNDALLPLDGTEPRRMLLVAIAGDPDAVPGADLERELRPRVDSLQVVRADTRYSRIEHIKLPPPESYDVALLALFVRVADRKNTVGLPADQAAFAKQFLANGKSVIVAAFGNPYLISAFPEARTWLCVFSTFDVSQRSAARALFGQTAVTGKLPVSVPGLFNIGDGLRTAADPMKLRPASADLTGKLAPVRQLLDQGVAERVFPGGVLAVGYRGELSVYPFGRQTYDATSPPILSDTMYDLASITKPVAAGTAVALLVSSGQLQLDARVVTYVPEFAGGPISDWRKMITVRHLLTHTSGLPDGLDPPAEENEPRAALLQRILHSPLRAEPGTQYQYSSAGFEVLAELIRRVTGKPLDIFLRERVFAPLGMDRTMFNPPPASRPHIPPIREAGPAGPRVQGESHWLVTRLLGGVGGASGLFSTAEDLAVFAQMLLNGGVYAHQRLFRRRTIADFTQRPPDSVAAHALGWATPSFLPMGQHWSATSFGHQGITGTLLWVDPEKHLFLVLLTNSAYPGPLTEEKMRAFRPQLCDAVIQALALVPQH